METTVADRLVYITQAYEEAALDIQELGSLRLGLLDIHNTNLNNILKLEFLVNTIREKMTRLIACCPAGPAKQKLETTLRLLDSLNEPLARARVDAEGAKSLPIDSRLSDLMELLRKQVQISLEYAYA